VERASTSQLAVALRQFRKHRLAVWGGRILLVLYLMAAFAGFFSPYDPNYYELYPPKGHHPPTRIHFVDPETGRISRPFVYATKRSIDPVTLQPRYEEDPSQGKFYVRFFVRTPEQPYREPIRLDPDDLIMRTVEIIAAIPSLFLLISLRAVFPTNIDPLLTFYLVVGLLGFIGWGGLARVVRGIVLSVREMDYVQAARALGASDGRIIARHVLPATASYVIVSLSLTIPGFILGESGLSFLGLGVTEPYTSWGLLLQAAQQGGFASFTDRPWVLWPGFFIFLSVLSWNFLGDGLRDALDPRRRQ